MSSIRNGGSNINCILNNVISTRVVVEARTSETKTETETWVAETKAETEAY